MALPIARPPTPLHERGNLGIMRPKKRQQLTGRGETGKRIGLRRARRRLSVSSIPGGDAISALLLDLHTELHGD